MLRSLAAMGLAVTAVVCAPAAAQAPDKPAPEVAKAPAKLLYAEGGMLVLVAPTFPKEALARGESATVIVTGKVQTDGRLENIRIETTPPNEAFEGALMDVAALWRLQPRIVSPGCGAVETQGRVTIWFEIEQGMPKVRYAAARPPATDPPPRIYNDRIPLRAVAPRYPPMLAVDPKTPRSIMQLAYLGVAEDGAVINVTVAPMLYYRDFEPLIVEAVRQWKYAPQDGPWCGETVFNLALEPN
jgi:TonB family protein